MNDLKELGDRIYLIEKLYNEQIINIESFTYKNIFPKRY